MENAITEIISIKQLPIIEEQLHKIKDDIELSTAEALSLVCTEDTVKTVKDKRASLNKQFNEFESRRKEVKGRVLEPYNAFEKVYKDCITEPFENADKQLAQKINNVESSLKDEKRNTVTQYYSEYKRSIGLENDDAPIETAGLNVTLSATLKSLKEQARAHLDNIRDDIQMIATLPDHDEVMVEYRKNGNLTQAVTTVAQRHKDIEEAKQKAEIRKATEAVRAETQVKVETAVLDAEKETPQLTAPIAVPVVDDEPITEPEQMYSVTFTVCGSMKEIKALKEFLIANNYDFQ